MELNVTTQSPGRRETIKYPITPVPKPRMTRSDKWKAGKDCRPPVARYWAFKDEVRLRKVFVPESDYHITFVVPMPGSWTLEKKAEMCGQPHQQKPDKDNLEKALLDAIYEDDCRVWDGRVTKVWGVTGEIIIETGVN